MKKMINVFSSVICALTLIMLFGCQNPAGNNTGTNNNNNTAAKQAVYDKFLGTWKNTDDHEIEFKSDEIRIESKKTIVSSVNDVILLSSEYIKKTNYTEVSFESDNINQCGVLSAKTPAANSLGFFKYRFISDTQCFLQYLGTETFHTLNGSSHTYTKQTGGGSGGAGGGIDFTISDMYTVNDAPSPTTVTFSSNTWTATKNTVSIKGSYTQTNNSLQVTYEKNGYSQTEIFTISGTADIVTLTLSTAGTETVSVILSEWGIVGTSVTLTR